MTDLAVRTTTVPSPEWVLIQSQAVELAKSDIIPRAYRGRPANVIVAALTGRHYGWDVLTAMRNGHVIEGVWAMRPEAMLGLVRQAGHSVKAEMVERGARVHGIRADNGDELTVSFTYEDAARAGLCAIKDGMPFARSSTNRPLPWEQYPQVMCYWRSVALLCRLLFSDITAGVHSAEELGAVITPDGDVIEDAVVIHEEDAGPVLLSEDTLAKFRETCETEGLAPDQVIAAALGEDELEGVLQGTRPLTEADLPALRDAFKSLVEPKPPPVPEVRPATQGQVGLIKAHYEAKGYDRDVGLANTGTIIGRTISSHNELTADEAEMVFEAEQIRHDEKLPGI